MTGVSVQDPPPDLDPPPDPAPDSPPDSPPDLGRHSGLRVTAATLAVALAAVVADLLLVGRLSLFFDLVFVVVSLSAPLAVRRRDFFVVGVLPPVLFAGVVMLLAVVRRTAVAEPGDGFVQAVVSGLAHHATALAVGYALTLATLAARLSASRISRHEGAHTGS